MRNARAIAALFVFACCATQVAAQEQPATIPTLVAHAMSLESQMFGEPHYLDGSLPADWPPELVPDGAKIIGGGWVGDTRAFRDRTAVIALASGPDVEAQLQRLLTNAGYTEPPTAGFTVGFVRQSQRGFSVGYCKAGTMAVVETMEVTPVAVIAVHLIDGETARQNCIRRPESVNPGRFPVTVPTMTAPQGAASFGGGSSWGGSSGSTTTTLRTTLSVDSILDHYTGELVAGGWKAAGKPGLADSAAVQRFYFTEKQERWTATLSIVAVGEKREILLQFAKAE